MIRLRTILVGLLMGVVLVAGCEERPEFMCGQEDAGKVVIEAKAGRVNDDGSVTVYGSVGATSTVRAVYVAGVEAQPGTDGFNFRSWSVSVPADRIVAHAEGAKTAKLPVVAYHWGNCVTELPVAEQPEVEVKSLDGGTQDAGRADADATTDGSSEAGDADVSDAPTEGG